MKIDLQMLRVVLTEQSLDGWLLFDFHGLNPLVRKLVGVTGLNSRRLFVMLPREGEPVALVHAIEVDGLHEFPGTIRTYARWQELEQGLSALVAGKRVALEISPDGAVPYLDRVPAGMLQLLERLGAVAVPSADLVARFGSVWTEADVASHHRAAAACWTIAAAAFDTIRDHRVSGSTVRERAIQSRIQQAFDAQDLETEGEPIVAFGVNSANPHYGPEVRSDATLAEGEVVLIDLWCKEPGGAFADQTWMGFAGTPGDRVREVWHAVRDARDAVVTELGERFAAGRQTRGADLDDVARGHLAAQGLAEAFVHRTGHSIHHELHGIGAHLDNYETRDTRLLTPVCGFSVEPGVYLAGEFGVRSEINVLLLADGPTVTPTQAQRELILV